MLKQIKNTNSGITIITLAVTIIVLVILAGVSINMLVGDNGIITKAQEAKENISIAKQEEEQQFNELYSILENGGGELEGEGDNMELIEKLKKEIEELKKQISNIMQGYRNVFDYTGEVQEWRVPVTGIYKLEVYGAQGR